MVFLPFRRHLFASSVQGGLSVCFGFAVASITWQPCLLEDKPHVHLMVSCRCPSPLNALVLAPSLAVPAFLLTFSLCKSFIHIFLSFELTISSSFDILLTFTVQFFLLHCEDICGVICSLCSAHAAETLVQVPSIDVLVMVLVLP